MVVVVAVGAVPDSPSPPIVLVVVVAPHGDGWHFNVDAHESAPAIAPDRLIDLVSRHI